LQRRIDVHEEDIASNANVLTVTSTQWQLTYSVFGNGSNYLSVNLYYY